MSLIPNLTYLIVPKASTPESDVVGIGPILPDIFPPPDETAKITSLIQRWLLVPGPNANTFTVFAGPKGEVGNYKWIIKEKNVLFVSAVSSTPASFRFEPAGGNFYVIGIPNQDALLTAHKNIQPQLTFKPADGSDAQLFQILPIERG